MAKAKTFQHRGNRWRLVRRKIAREKSYGYVDGPAREIVIDERLDGWLLGDTTLHEFAHLAMPDLAEDAILRLVRYQIKGLHLAGFDLEATDDA